MALELPQNGWQASLRKRGMDARNKIQSLSWQEQDQGSHRSSSSWSFHQSCHKRLWQKTTLWPPSSNPAPSPAGTFPLPKTFYHSASPPLQYPATSMPVHAQKATLSQQFSSCNKLGFMPWMTFPIRELRAGSANRLPWLCSRLLMSSGHCPSPCPHPACALSADSQPGSPVLFNFTCSPWQPLLTALFGLWIIQFSEFHLSF